MNVALTSSTGSASSDWAMKTAASVSRIAAGVAPRASR